MTEASEIQFASASELDGGKANSSDDGGEVQTTRAPAVVQPRPIDQPAEELISTSDGEPAWLGMETPSGDVQRIIASLPNLDENPHRGKPIVWGSLEQRIEDSTQRRLSHSSPGGRRSPMFFAYPGESCALYTELLQNGGAGTHPRSTCREQTPLITNTRTEEPEIAPLQGAITRAGKACREGLRACHSPISLHLMTEEMMTLTDGGTFPSCRAVTTHQESRSLVLASDAEASSILVSTVQDETTEPRTGPASHQTPALRRESPLNPQELGASTAPRTSDFRSESSSNVQNSTSIAIDVADGSSNPASNATQSTSLNANHPVADGSLNVPNVGDEFCLHSDALHSFGGTRRAVEALRQVRSTRMFESPPISHGATSSVSGSAGEYPFRPLFRDNLDDNFIGETDLLQSSRLAYIPPFRRPFDVTPLLERAERDLASATTPLVPVLPPSLPGSEEVAVRSSLDSLTLGSISWLNSVADSGTRRQNLRQGEQGVEGVASASLDVAEEGKDSTGGTLGESNWNQQTTYIADAPARANMSKN
ncbi:uncharacterized protein Tco025E_07671 [Trypanosoma conorhini]|uniref:Uncharacterized protein n=1 Tax=Trypanosoma conorhini TaxID=83891 RepID=A0A422NKS6_9TRYP|nr:uncharacterized protein Tco025E_07671 [Trypanosoma conorhini]RNF06056.1 hypothetical protein Tco025E_07671 [Trypanosoma conorhini]